MDMMCIKKLKIWVETSFNIFFSFYSIDGII